MGIGSVLKMLLGSPLEVVGEAYRARQERKAEERRIESAIRMKKIDYVNEGRIAEVEWNKTASANNKWRADWLTFLLSLPLILIFGPDALQAQIADGFHELDKLPDWYKAGVGLMIGSAFGFQKYTNVVMNRAFKLPNKIQSSVEALNEADKK